MKRRTPPSLSAVFVNYHGYERLEHNLHKLVDALFDYRLQIIIVDNSGQEAFNKCEQILEQLPTSRQHAVTALQNSQNCRFRAYNLGLRLAYGDFVVFRSDDDRFNEQAIADALQSSALQERDKVVAFSYTFDGTKEKNFTCRRPIETVLVPRSQLPQVHHVPEQSSGDWLFLERLHAQQDWYYSHHLLMDKVPHGR